MKRLLWTLAVLALGLFLVQAFWVGVYRVDTASMEPAILGSVGRGEQVLVVYDRSPPERFEVVAILRKGERVPVVKRAVGLPGERFQVSNGDVLIDGKRLPMEAARPDWIPIFDSRMHDVKSAFSMGSSTLDPWEDEGGFWRLDAREVERGFQAGLMFLRKGLHDGYLLPDGTIVYGKERVGDGAIECDVRFDELMPEGRFRIQLLEQGDAFQMTIEPGDPGIADVSITRRNRSDAGAEMELASTGVSLDLADWNRVRFSNRDNHLVVEIGALGAVLQASYDANVPHPREGDTAMGRNPVTQGALGGEACRLSLRAIRVLRDLHYVARGDFGCDQDVSLGPDEIFVLGDNSAESLDSRSFGKVSLDEVIGRPVQVVWPLSRWRPIMRKDR